jgi:predicted transcriptional regulator
MNIIVIASCLACISFSALSIYKFHILENKIFSKEDIENMAINSLAKVFTSIHKENQVLKNENFALKKETNVLKEKLEKITKQIDSFNKVFKQ